MSVDSSERMRYISEILDSSRSVNSSKLVSLSCLNNEEVEFLAKVWPEADLDRRQDIISQLVHLSEVDLRLDFSSVFVLSLRDTDEEIRLHAAEGLEGEDNYLLIKPLIKTLKEDTSVQVRAAAASALREFALQGELGNLPTYYREKLYNSLVDILANKSEPTEVVRRALEAISPFSLPRVRELIEEAYHTDDIKLRASAIYAMGRNCDLAWLPTLLLELSNDRAEIRYEAVAACGELGAEEAVPYLLDIVADRDEHVKEAVIKALGEIGNETAKRALRELSKNPQPLIRDAAKSALKGIRFCENPLSADP
jgi:HEAT repeat protein